MIMTTNADSTTSIADLKAEVRAFIEARNWDQFHPPKDLAIGLITEASELLELFRFQSDDDIEVLLNDDTFSQKLRHELADCLYFILAISNKLDIDLADALQEKLFAHFRSIGHDLKKRKWKTGLNPVYPSQGKIKKDWRMTNVDDAESLCGRFV